MVECFSCHKKIGMFSKQANEEFIVTFGYASPEGMTKHDKLCQTCLDNIKNTQVQGKIRQFKQSVFWNIIILFLLAPVPFYFVNRLTKWVLYSVIPWVSVMLFGGLITTPELIGVGAIGFVAFNIYFIIRWTEEWNTKIDREYNNEPTADSKSPMTMLKERYAKGEIPKEEFDKIKEDLKD